MPHTNRVFFFYQSKNEWKERDEKEGYSNRIDTKLHRHLPLSEPYASEEPDGTAFSTFPTRA